MYFEVSNIYVQSDMASHASGLINLARNAVSQNSKMILRQRT